MPTSIFSRKRDLVYMVYFTIAIPIALVMDVQPLYPPHLVPSFLTAIQDYYVKNYNDQFYVNTPTFFINFLWIELIYQVPVAIWALRALYKESPKVPLVLLPFAVKVFLTTLTCMLEFPSWEIPLEQKLTLTTLYGPYLLLSAYMMVDMYLRLNSVINQQVAMSIKDGQKKSQ